MPIFISSPKVLLKKNNFELFFLFMASTQVQMQPQTENLSDLNGRVQKRSSCCFALTKITFVMGRRGGEGANVVASSYRNLSLNQCIDI